MKTKFVANIVRGVAKNYNLAHPDKAIPPETVEGLAKRMSKSILQEMRKRLRQK